MERRREEGRGRVDREGQGQAGVCTKAKGQGQEAGEVPASRSRLLTIRVEPQLMDSVGLDVRCVDEASILVARPDGPQFNNSSCELCAAVPGSPPGDVVSAAKGSTFEQL